MHRRARAMTPIRPPAVAGSWYPGTAAALATAVDGHLAATAIATLAGDLVALDRAARRPDVLGAGGRARLSAARGPHVRRRRARRSVAFCRLRRRVVVSIRRLRDAARRVADRRGLRAIAFARPRPSIREHPAAHAREHSLEMQLPFIQRLAPALPIVPLVMGYQTAQTAFSLGDALAAALADAARCWWPAPTCRTTTTRPPRKRSMPSSSTACRASTPTACSARSTINPEHACGGGPTVAVMRAAQTARRARRRRPRLRGFR